MHESAALYEFFTQLRAMQVLFTSPEQYASKLMSDSPEAIQFKYAKTILALQKILNTMCTTTTVTPSATDTAHNWQQLSQQLTNPERLTFSSAASLTCETTVSQGTHPRQLIVPTAVS